jgi:choline dehydrogenase
MSKINERLRADYVIVGGGSAGLVLANRLTEDGASEVLLLEAGGESSGFLVQMPAGYGKLVGNPENDWMYRQVPDPTINHRQKIWSAGKLLGGGSSINGQVYIRGTRRDFDYWPEAGAAGWGYDDVEPYFRKLEQWRGSPDQVHGESGLLSVSPMRGPNPLCRQFLDACKQVGSKIPSGYNDGEMDGAFLTVGSQRDGWRCSAEKAYLRPARNRPNLTVVTHAEVKTVRFSGKRAVGVSFERHGKILEMDARKEVIVSAGTVGSPALLMRSGIGDGTYLRNEGMAVIHDLPGVGRNLQEHPAVRISKRIDRRTLNSESALGLLLHVLRFAVDQKGPMSLPVVQAMALARTREDLVEPNVQLHFIPMCTELDTKTMQIAKDRVMTIGVTACRPLSRGRVKLDSSGRPLITHEFFSDERDLETMVQGGLLAERIFNAPPLVEYVTGNYHPAPVPQTREEWVSYIRDTCGVGFHPVGTCKIGTDTQAVVDPWLRVRGIDGLRIVDASVMPRITSANTNATTIMIAEKAADLIRHGSASR